LRSGTKEIFAHGKQAEIWGTTNPQWFTGLMEALLKTVTDNSEGLLPVLFLAWLNMTYKIIRCTAEIKQYRTETRSGLFNETPSIKNSAT